MPNTRAHSSLVSDEAIWKLRRRHGIRNDLLDPPTPPDPPSGHSRGDGHEELVEASEQNVGRVADPDVVRVDHEEQQARLQGRDGADHQLGPDLPPDPHEARHEGHHRTCADAKQPGVKHLRRSTRADNS